MGSRAPDPLGGTRSILIIGLCVPLVGLRFSLPRRPEICNPSPQFPDAALPGHASAVPLAASNRSGSGP
jgi:hypothetical protein